MNIYQRVWNGFIDTAFGAVIARRVELAVKAIDRVTDTPFNQQAQIYDRFEYDRSKVLERVIEAVRENPMARRIVSIMTQYVVGGGVEIVVENERAEAFLMKFWRHRLNRMDVRLPVLCDELGSSGNLFIVLTTDAAGMSYLRCVPTFNIAEIKTANNDVEQEQEYIEKLRYGQDEPARWQAYNPANDNRGESGDFAPVMLHYAVNRAAGALWGESDLAPGLKWLIRHTQWLEDRVRLNHFRQLFLFVVRSALKGEARKRREHELNANPPKAGSILVTGDDEEWGILHPQLDSFEASEDGLNVKKMVSAGVGYPLHFLAEPEGTNRTTAEFSGGPTFRQFEQRQKYFLWIVQDILEIVLERRRKVSAYGLNDVEISVRGGDMSVRDNTNLADAARKVWPVMNGLHEKELISDEELLRMVYRFSGEQVDVEQLLKQAKEGEHGETA